MVAASCERKDVMGVSTHNAEVKSEREDKVT